MATFTMRHELDCTPEKFWTMFFDLDFNERLFKSLEFPSWALLSSKETDTAIIRTVKATPKMDAPAAVAKLLGSKFGYDEVSTFDKASKVLRFVITTNVMSDKLRNSGTVKVEPLGDARSARIVEISLEAKVFGIGGMIESAFEKSLRSGWGKSADFTNREVRT